MARRSGKAVWETGQGQLERVRPTTPKDFTEPLKMSMYGRPFHEGSR